LLNLIVTNSDNINFLVVSACNNSKNLGRCEFAVQTKQSPNAIKCIPEIASLTA